MAKAPLGTVRIGEGQLGGGFRPNMPNPGGVLPGPAAPGTTRGLVKLWSPELGTTVSARNLAAPQVVQERAGGWEVRNRPGQLPRTTRPGSGQLLRIKLTLIVDGWSPPKRSVQPEINAFRRLGYRLPDGRDPVVYVVGAVPYADGGLREGFRDVPPDWVVERLEIVEKLHMSNGTCCRAEITVELLEHVEGSSEIRRAKATRATSYTWRKGDTLSKVAKKKLGASSRAKWIRDANPKIKSWAKVKPGTKVKIPGISRRMEG